MLPYYLNFARQNPKLIIVAAFGIILIALGAFSLSQAWVSPKSEVMVLDEATEGQGTQEIIAEVSGEVEKPGVYRLSAGSRINDLLIAAGGISQNADRVWLEKTLNRAAKLVDGQKIFIPSQSEVLSAKTGTGNQTISGENTIRGSGLVNINDATLKELDSLPGIGPVYAQKIIDHRPYSSVEELLSKGVLKKNVYGDIKDKISVY